MRKKNIKLREREKPQNLGTIIGGLRMRFPAPGRWARGGTLGWGLGYGMGTGTLNWDDDWDWNLGLGQGTNWDSGRDGNWDCHREIQLCPHMEQ